MSSPGITVLLWAAALSSGLIAGIYFAFSTFIMRSFKAIDSAHAIAAMNSINETILRSLFMPLFFGSSLISVLLVVVGITRPDNDAAGSMLLAGAVYFVGMFVCTVVFNVPLNNKLAKAQASRMDSQDVWSHYLKHWTRWNHLRTGSSLLSCILCIFVLSS